MTVNYALAWLNGEAKHRTGIAVLQRAIALALLFRICTEAPFAGFLWGPHSIATGHLSTALYLPLGTWADSAFGTLVGTYAFLGALALSCLLLLFQVRTQIATIATWLLFLVLGYRLRELNDGGDNLATLALLYMSFTIPAQVESKPGSLRSWIHNLAVVSLGVQIALVYFTSGFMKLNGDSWHNGTALYLISQVEWFSLPRTREWFRDPFISTISTYSTMIFQIWFPVLLFTRARFAVVAIAMCFHVGVAVTMGLLTFSLVMSGADLFYLSDSEYAAASARKSRIHDALRQWRLRWWKAPAIVFYDGACPFCVSFVQRVRTLDWSTRFAFVSFRESDAYHSFNISAKRLESEMHIVVQSPPSPLVKSGFSVVPVLMLRLPLAWLLLPALPVVWVFDKSGIGARLYQQVARRRYAGCDETCRPPSPIPSTRIASVAGRRNRGWD